MLWEGMFLYILLLLNAYYKILAVFFSGLQLLKIEYTEKEKGVSKLIKTHEYFPKYKAYFGNYHLTATKEIRVGVFSRVPGHRRFNTL